MPTPQLLFPMLFQQMLTHVSFILRGEIITPEMARKGFIIQSKTKYFLRRTRSALTAVRELYRARIVFLVALEVFFCGEIV